MILLYEQYPGQSIEGLIIFGIIILAILVGGPFMKIAESLGGHSDTTDPTAGKHKDSGMPIKSAWATDAKRQRARRRYAAKRAKEGKPYNPRY